MDTQTALLRRRSVKPQEMQSPGPEGEALQRMLQTAIRVPDHGKLAPWRIVMLEKHAQARLGAFAEARFRTVTPDATEALCVFERERVQRAPLLLVVIHSPKIGKIPLWEQQLSCGALCMNLLNACHLEGFAACWLTEWLAYDPEIASHLGLNEEERIAGFFYIGTVASAPEERWRPEVEDVVKVW